MEEQGNDAPTADVYDKAKPSKFHFKSGSKRRSKHHASADEQDATERRSKRHRSEEYESPRRSKRSSRRKDKSAHHSDRHPTSTLDGAYYDPDYRHRESLYDDVEAQTTDPTTTFRESLFDALADDEGAAYWEGVYGQPVHIYPDTKPGPHGTLERMNEEEYADYVRTKMWEKSHQHIVQEREARERERKKRKEARRGMDEHVEREEREGEDIRRRMEESLRRGEERRRAKEVEAAWEAYLKKWEALKGTANLSEEIHVPVRDILPWPVLSAKAKHVTKDEIERFLRQTQAWKTDASAVLKAERVRWHPDKLQQRFGQHVDAETMKLITAVFQVVDRLWNDRK